MNVLVTWGSKLGGTEGIARRVAVALQAEGHTVTSQPAGAVHGLAAFDGVVIGGALYASRWHVDARRFVAEHVRELRRMPVWLFSSGPLDATADADQIPPVTQVQALMERIGAQGHVTFGGRLEAGARGFTAQAMAKTRAGDWRNPERIRAWATEVGRALPHARPRAAVVPPGRPLVRLLGHAAFGWMACAAILLALLALTSTTTALVVRAVATPLVFAPLAWRYFRVRGAREALPAALGFAAVAAILDLAIVGTLIAPGGGLVLGVTGWLTLALIVLVTWPVGFVTAMLPARYHPVEGPCTEPRPIAPAVAAAPASPPLPLPPPPPPPPPRPPVSSSPAR